MMLGVVLTIVISPFGRRLPEEHLDRLHATETEHEWHGSQDRRSLSHIEEHPAP